MKKVSILAASLLASTIGFSQVSLDPEVGINFSEVKTKVGDNDASTTDSKTGFRAGVGVNIDLYKGLYLRPGVYYSQLGGKTELLGTTTTSTLHYLEVPVNIGYRYELSPKVGNVFAEVGPYAGIALSGKVKTEIGDFETKKDINFGDEANEMKPMDWGFKFGIGYETPWGIYVKGNYGLGLGNLSNLDNVTSTNRAWNVSLGYRINF
jgi:hypothetical protein